MHTPQLFFDFEEVHVVSSLVCEDVCQEQNPFTLASAMCNPEDRAPQSVWAKCCTVGGTARMKSSETALNGHNLVIETVPNKKVVTKVVFCLLLKRKLFACHLNRLQMLCQSSSFIWFYINRLWFMIWFLMYTQHFQIWSNLNIFFDLELRTPNSSKISRSISTWLHCPAQGYMARCVMSLGATC